MNGSAVEIGLERLSHVSVQPWLANRRLGLLFNQASVDHCFCMAPEVVTRNFPRQLTTLFSPQHGVWGEQQANMIESPHGHDENLDLPLYSLYSATRRPTSAMLEHIDCMIVDLQDVGTRVYTFIWTLMEVLKACKFEGKSIVVLDRPNPLGGEVFEGPVLQSQFSSFVGNWNIPMRHGMTIGELALLFNSELGLEADLHVVTMYGWNRHMYFGECHRSWVWPSPNMPSVTTALLYPGQVLLEGVNLSEGRGTTRPFELIGAPFVDSSRWLKELEQFNFPGVKLLPTRFKPTFDKWMGQSCEGLDIRVLDHRQLRSFEMTVALVATAAKLFPEFCWLPPPYEYETVKPPIDILFGSDRLRWLAMEYRQGNISPRQLIKSTECDSTGWQSRIASSLLYN